MVSPISPSKCPGNYSVRDALINTVSRLRNPVVISMLVASLYAMYYTVIAAADYSSTYCATFSDCIYGGTVAPFHKNFAWTQRDRRRKILMVVAHPDDDALWGGEFLLDHGNNTHVVITSGLNEKTELRRNEFRHVEKHAGFRGEFLLGHDTFASKSVLEDWIKERIQTLVCGQQWDMIVTHNPDGEYGHPQHQNAHKAVVDAVRHCCKNADKLHVFFPAPPGCAEHNGQPFSERKVEVLLKYPSQSPVIWHSCRDWNERIVPLREYNYTRGHEYCVKKCLTHRMLEQDSPEKVLEKAKEFHLLYPYEHDWEFQGHGVAC